MLTKEMFDEFKYFIPPEDMELIDVALDNFNALHIWLEQEYEKWKKVRNG